MTHRIDMILDLQYGSTGKGLIAGWLAKRMKYDTAICAFATNAGHTYIDNERGLSVMTQQLPTAITSPTVKNILLGPGSAISAEVLLSEMQRYNRWIAGKRIMIHPHAAVVEEEHANFELRDGRTNMGSTAKGVGEAYIERIRRDTANANVAAVRWRDHPVLKDLVVTIEEYEAALMAAENVIIEGAQGFSLSIYHGQYPYTTSRDVTPWQIAADCGLPFRWASRINVIGTLRTYPIRVNNRTGSSGPCYPDQVEIEWESIGIPAETTTVTKLPRRIFTFSETQFKHAMLHCAHYWQTQIFLNFANYMTPPEVDALVKLIERVGPNAPAVKWLGYGPDDASIVTREEYNLEIE